MKMSEQTNPPMAEIRPVQPAAPARPPAPPPNAGIAIASMILGIVSYCLCCAGILLSLPAIICGHIGLSRIKKSGGTLGGRGFAIAGLALGYSNLVVSLVMAIFYTAITIPAFVKARDTSMQNACVNNMRQIDSGKEQYAMAARKTDGDAAPAASVNAYIKGNTTPKCPGGGTYTYGNIGTDPDCNIASPTAHDFAK